MKQKEEFEDLIPRTNGIYFKLWKAKQNIKKIAKNSINPHFKNNYADINALLEEVEPILLEHNLLLIQPIDEGHVKTVIIDIETGENLSSSMKLPDIQDPQKIGSAVTYFRRYTLQSILSLQAVDDDANLSTEAIKTQKPTISDERFDRAIEAIRKGEAKVKDLDAFNLTKQQLLILATI
jgi:hypothetical protein